MHQASREIRLANGMRVLIQATSGPPAVAVSISYGVGFRSESEGRSGFAHLFEHMMFQGSAHVPDEGHFATVQSLGGVANGRTFQDHTEYHQVVPAVSLQDILRLEADRMACLEVDANKLLTQISVVKEEIRSNVTNRPYGGFPWTVLPSATYSTWRHAHNGYGDLSDVERASVAECYEFYHRYYSPNNAVLSICGNVDPHQVEAMVDACFSNIPASADIYQMSDRAEVEQAKGGEPVIHRDHMAPRPATALGYCMPNAAVDLHAYASHMCLSTLLTGGKQSLLRTVLPEASSACGYFGPLTCSDPDTFVITSPHDESKRADTRALIDDTLRAIANGGLDDERATVATDRTLMGQIQAGDSLLSRASIGGTGWLLLDRPHLWDQLMTTVQSIGSKDLVHAAAQLVEQTPGTVHLVTA